MVSVTSLDAPQAEAIGIGAPIGRFILVAVWALIVLGTALNENLPDTSWVALPLAAGVIGGLLAANPGETRLGPVLSSGAVVCAIISSTVLFGMEPQGQMLWLYFYAAYILGTIAMRGNLLAMTIGSVGVLGIGAIWAAQFQPTLSGFVLVLGLPVILLAACVTWHHTLVRVVSRKIRYRSDAERAQLAEEAAKFDLARSNRELDAVRGEAGPLLTRLLAGEPISDGFRLELRMAEARVRDRVRAPFLLHPTLETAVQGARLRSDEVVLIGGPLSEEPDIPEPSSNETSIGGHESKWISDALANVVADQLNTIEGNVSITIRSMPTGSQAALSLLIRSETETRHTRFAQDGTVLTET